MLSDRDIRKAMDPGHLRLDEDGNPLTPLSIIPAPEDHQFQPCTIDLRLGSKFIYWVGRKQPGWPIEVQQRVAETPCFLLKQGQFVLAETHEIVGIPDWLCAKVDGRSSIGRQGVTAHITAGLIDPGFNGKITLEIKNLGYETMKLEAGMRICQLEFHALSSPVERPYGHPGLKSKYQNQLGVQAALKDL